MFSKFSIRQPTEQDDDQHNDPYEHQYDPKHNDQPEKESRNDCPEEPSAEHDGKIQSVQMLPWPHRLLVQPYLLRASQQLSKQQAEAQTGEQAEGQSTEQAEGE